MHELRNAGKVSLINLMIMIIARMDTSISLVNSRKGVDAISVPLL